MPAFFADTVAIPPSGVVVVREYDSSPPPAGSLGLDENRRHPTLRVARSFAVILSESEGPHDCLGDAADAGG